MDNKHIDNNDVAMLIGELEILSLSIAPGVVVTDEMSLITNNILSKVLRKLRLLKKRGGEPLTVEVSSH